MVHLAWESVTFENSILAALTSILEVSDWLGIRNAFKLVRIVVSIADSRQKTRIGTFLSAIFAVLRDVMEFYKVALHIISGLLMLAARNDFVFDWLRDEAPISMRDLHEWLEENPGLRRDHGLQNKCKYFYRDTRSQRAAAFSDDDPSHELMKRALRALQGIDGGKRELTGYDEDEDDPESIVNRRLRIYWPKMGQWYSGTIINHSAMGHTGKSQL